MISLTTRQKKRAIQIIVILSLLCTAIFLILYALSKNINLYYTPTQITTGKAPLSREIRVGGLVKNNSVHYQKIKLGVDFLVTDINKTILVHYVGILPDLFAEGQAVVVEGKLKNNRLLMADKVLAKHDEKYMPQEVKETLKQQQLLT